MLALSRSMAVCLQCRLSRACIWQGRSGDTCTLYAAPIGSLRVDPEEQRKRITALEDEQRIPGSRSHFLRVTLQEKHQFPGLEMQIFRMGPFNPQLLLITSSRSASRPPFYPRDLLWNLLNFAAITPTFEDRFAWARDRIWFEQNSSTIPKHSYLRMSIIKTVVCFSLCCGVEPVAKVKVRFIPLGGGEGL